jgi:hypothetical protein
MPFPMETNSEERNRRIANALERRAIGRNHGG